MEASAQQQQAWLNQMKKGRVAFSQGQLGVAVQAFNSAAQVLPNKMEGWVNLGSALLQSGQYRLSEDALRRAIAIAPSVMASHMLMGDTLRLQGRSNEALSAYERAVALQRSPMALNKLACAQRSRRDGEKAEALYKEAISIEPRFSLARVNLGTLLLEIGKFESAEAQLNNLQGEKLPPAEQTEVKSALLCLGEYRRLNPAIETMVMEGKLEPLKNALSHLPNAVQGIDKPALEKAQGYLKSAQGLGKTASQALIELPENWPLIEGLFMIPLVNSVEAFRAKEKELAAKTSLTLAERESVNVAGAVVAARACKDSMNDPASAESNLRHWHSLCCRDLTELSGGHFKYTQNWSTKSPTLKRVEPALASATFQRYMQNFHYSAPTGLTRAAMSFMAACDLHCFGDGNGRTILTWVNRQLEWNGEMPMLFTKEMGLKGELGAAMKSVRSNGGDLKPLVEVFLGAQRFALKFREELAAINAA